MSFFCTNYDLVIVGGGISGLFLAYKLSETNLKILLIEKEKKLGGRIHTIKKDNYSYECGAARFNENHLKLISLINELDLQDQMIQLQKDIDSTAGVIPIFPWIKNGLAKDDMVPAVYANALLAGKGGSIVNCDSTIGPNGCPYESMFWRSDDNSSRMLVPSGWTLGGMDFTLCSMCRAIEREHGIIDEEERLELDRQRYGINVDDGSTGMTTSINNKPLVNDPYTPTKYNNNRKPTLLEEAERLFKGKISNDTMKELKKEIKKEESKKRANAAEKRKWESKYERSEKRSKKKGGRKRGRTRRKKRTKRKRKR